MRVATIGRGLALAAVLGMPIPGREQAAPQQPLVPGSSDNVLRVNVNLIQIDAEVLDKQNGRPVDGLHTQDFTVEEDGQRERIADVSRDQTPLSVVLLVDETDTVRPVLATLARGAGRALARLRPEDEVAVISYGSATQLRQGLTTERDPVIAAIERASQEVDRSPAFYNEAIYQSASLLQRTAAPGHRKVVIWLTDNVPNQPDGRVHSEQEAMQAVYSAGVVVMALVKRSGLSNVFALVNKNPLASSMHRHDPAGDVYRYVARTGGDVVKADENEMNNRLAELIDSLRARYRVSFYPASREPQQRLHRVKISVPGDNGRVATGVVIRAPWGYYR